MSGKTKSVLSAMSVASSLMILDYYPGSEPEWANKTIREESTNYFWDLHSMVASFHAVQRLTAGWILADFVDEFKTYMGRRTERRFVGYSLHVDNQNAVLVALNNNTAPKQWPPLGAFMSVEMHYINETWVVRAFYWNKSYTDPTEVMIQNCSIPGPCTLEKFEEWTRNFFVEDWGTECGQTPEKNKLKQKDAYNEEEHPDSPKSKSNYTCNELLDEVSTDFNSTESCNCQETSDSLTIVIQSSTVNGILFVICIVFGLLLIGLLAYIAVLKRTISDRKGYHPIE